MTEQEKKCNLAFIDLLCKIRQVNEEAACFALEYTKKAARDSSLLCVFDWASTPQGHDYWYGIAKALGEL